VHNDVDVLTEMRVAILPLWRRNQRTEADWLETARAAMFTAKTIEFLEVVVADFDEKYLRLPDVFQRMRWWAREGRKALGMPPKETI